MEDTDHFCSPHALGIDSVQSTITSVTDSEFLHLSRDTLTTDDEGVSSGLTQPLSYASASDWLPEQTTHSLNEISAAGPESPVHTVRRTINNIDFDVDEDPSTNRILEVPSSAVIAPDGGWGWVIVVVSFMCAGVVDGLCSVFGILLPSLVTYFEQSNGRTAFAGSLLAGGFLLFGLYYEKKVLLHFLQYVFYFSNANLCIMHNYKLILL